MEEKPKTRRTASYWKVIAASVVGFAFGRAFLSPIFRAIPPPIFLPALFCILIVVLVVHRRRRASGRMTAADQPVPFGGWIIAVIIAAVAITLAIAASRDPLLPHGP